MDRRRLRNVDLSLWSHLVTSDIPGHTWSHLVTSDTPGHSLVTSGHLLHTWSHLVTPGHNWSHLTFLVTPGHFLHPWSHLVIFGLRHSSPLIITPHHPSSLLPHVDLTASPTVKISHHNLLRPVDMRDASEFNHKMEPNLLHIFCQSSVTFPGS